MTKPDPRDRALDVMLAERFGGVVPPDLAARILGAAARGERPEPWDEPDGPAATVDTPSRGATGMDSIETTFEIAAQDARQGLLHELYGFVVDNTKWWLVPFLLVFALFGLVLALGATGAAPFIYTLF